MTNGYLEVISLVERLHRHFLEVVKLELDGLGIHDINNVQGLMLFNIGDAEMTVGELTLRGCYLGSNVSYNVKKMVENGYLVQERSVHDRRSIHVRLTDKGPQAARPAELDASAPRRAAGPDRDHRRGPRVIDRDPAPARAVLGPRRRSGAAAGTIRGLAGPPQRALSGAQLFR